MNLEDKKEKLRELKKIDFPNDQEYNEMERLESEIALEYEDSIPIQAKNIEKNMEQKDKRTVFEFLADKIKEKQGKNVANRDPNRKSIIIKIGSGIVHAIKEKPVTDQEIYELKRKVLKYRLKADIAKSKAIINNSKTGKLAVLEKLFLDEKKPSRRSNSRTKYETNDYGNSEVLKYRKKVLGY